MKKITILSLLVLFFLKMNAQAPQGFNYQAVARDASGVAVTNQSIGLEISLLQGSVAGTVVYTETHSLTSNNLGLLNLVIGNGTIVTGNFGSIDWSAGPYFIEIRMDISGGSSYVLMGTQQLMSVPYALYAANSGSGLAGATGATGATGIAGANGTDGTSGATGATGVAGNNGTNGIDGAMGATGANGVDGAVGATGPTGANGIVGATGENGTNGTNGTNGATGATGANGIIGATGANGTNGTNGTNGVTGATGATGLTGATGAAGTNGTNGLNGATGATGTAGTNGTNGLNGVTGATGATGVAGTNGVNGTTGNTGAAGATGSTGATGVAGTNGINGVNGATGTTGPTGPQGTSPVIYYANGATDINQAGTSGGYPAMPDMTITFTLSSASTIRLDFSASGEPSGSTGGFVAARTRVDGVVLNGGGAAVSPVSGYWNLNIMRAISLSAGTHTISMDWDASGGMTIHNHPVTKYWHHRSLFVTVLP